ncbi:hypothetical protein ABK040_004059 [Willaertia magna]
MPKFNIKAIVSAFKKKLSGKNDEAEEGFNPIPSDSTILLLGTLESGKSTLFKQLRYISNNDSFTQEDISIMPYIHEIIIKTMRLLVVSMKDKIEKYVGKKFIISQDLYNKLLEMSDTTIFEKNFWNKELGSQIKEFYFENFNILQYILCDINSSYFYNIDFYMNKIDIIINELNSNFKDFLICRIKSTGYIEYQIKSYNNKTFTIMDVGGARNERRKWIHSFLYPNYIIYTVSLIDFVKKCYEDDITNRLIESLNLFGQLLSDSDEVEECWNNIVTRKGSFISNLFLTNIKKLSTLQKQLIKLLYFEKLIDIGIVFE